MAFIKDGNKLVIFSAKFMNQYRVFISRKATLDLIHTLEKCSNKIGSYRGGKDYILYTVDKYLRPNNFYAKIFHDYNDLMNEVLKEDSEFKDYHKIEEDELDIHGKQNDGIILTTDDLTPIFVSRYDGNILRELEKDELEKLYLKNFSNLYKEYDRKKINFMSYSNRISTYGNLKDFLNFLSFDKDIYNGMNEILKFKILNMSDSDSYSFIEKLTVDSYFYDDIYFIYNRYAYRNEFMSEFDTISSYNGIPHPNEYFFDSYRFEKDDIINHDLFTDWESSIDDNDITLYKSKFVSYQAHFYAKLKEPLEGRN